MIKEEFAKLLEKSWTEEEKVLILNIKESILYYKKLLPRTLETNVIAALKLCNSLKMELEQLKSEKTLNEFRETQSKIIHELVEDIKELKELKELNEQTLSEDLKDSE